MRIKSRYVDTSTGYVKLYIPGLGVIDEHRYVMRQHLGRGLGYNEVVHHRDGNKQNNVLNNLELVDRSSHARQHSSTGRTMIKLICAYCKEPFGREVSQVNTKRRLGQKNFYCGRSCVGKATGYGHLEQT